MTDLMTHASARLSMREFVELPLWADALRTFDAELAPDLSNAPELLAQVPLAAFAATLLNPPAHYPRAAKFLPSMPSDLVQRQWTGSDGTVLLETSLAFMAHAVAAAGGPSQLRGKRVLDFGIGWGRLAKLWLKYLPPDQLKGCDAWDKSLYLARECGIRNEMQLSDALLRTTPYPAKSFDLVYAFSIFTHLSERSFTGCLRGIRDMLVTGGRVVFTVRPRDFWTLRPDLPQQAELLQSTGFVFVPSQGLEDFGDTTLSTAWLRDTLQLAGLQLVAVEWSPVDALQVVIVAERVA